MDITINFDLRVDDFIKENLNKTLSSYEISDMVEKFYYFVCGDASVGEKKQINEKKSYTFEELIKLFLEQKYIKDNLQNFIQKNYDEKKILTEFKVK